MNKYFPFNVLQDQYHQFTDTILLVIILYVGYKIVSAFSKWDDPFRK